MISYNFTIFKLDLERDLHFEQQFFYALVKLLNWPRHLYVIQLIIFDWRISHQKFCCLIHANDANRATIQSFVYVLLFLFESLNHVIGFFKDTGRAIITLTRMTIDKMKPSKVWKKFCSLVFVSWIHGNLHMWRKSNDKKISQML